ncbi:hypothetical protein GYMLUDRAFT_237117 [Collybiopsis luxurians FD-317 M1]|nr:hypothetical protein GYMLUDRAFT_237117 [Collybiopsis luxurians FD-317 M1]
MSLVQLPDDILFYVLSFLKPPDLIHLRKTCKRLQAFTLERTVWKAAYRYSGYFLPPGPQPSQTVHDLERVLLRAHRWNKIWLKPPQTIAHTLACIWSFRTEIEEPLPVELVHGRYVLIKGFKGMRVYDLEIRHEIFKYQSTGDEQLDWPDYQHSRTAESEAELGSLTPFSRNERLAFLKVTSQGDIDLIDTEIRMIGNEGITTGYDCCVIQDSSNTISVLHVPSRKMYSLHPTSIDMQNVATLLMILPGYVLLFHDQFADTCVELYALPNHTTVLSGSSVKRTHSGTFQRFLVEEPLYLSSDISDQDRTGFIWAAAVFEDDNGEGVRPLRITLEPEAKLGFYLPNTPECDPSISMPFCIDYIAIGGTRARGIGYTNTIFGEGFDKAQVAIYDAYLGRDGDWRVDAACVHVPRLDGSCSFDVSVGLIHLRQDGVVEVLDLC